MARAPASASDETLPEADRLEGFAHPRETSVLFGHEAAEQALARAFAGGRMHHGWLFAGPQGIGKAALAYRFAAHILASAAERDPQAARLAVPDGSANARQVRALSHPGLFVLRRAWNARDQRFPAAIPVDDVRRLRTFLGHRAAEGAWRVIIADTADELNVNAANALLKILEEPPPRTVFLLLSEAPGRLLATIRSRCRMLPLAPLGGEDLRRAVSHALTAAGVGAPDETAWAELERLSEGSVRRALGLLAGGGLDLHARLLGILEALPKLDWRAAHALADELAAPGAEQRFELFFDVLLATLAGLVRTAAAGTGGARETEIARRLMPESRLAMWAALWETISREKALAAALNLDRKMLIVETLLRMEAAARSG